MMNNILGPKKLLILFFIALNNLFAQEALELREYFPPSPTAQEFIKYGEYPVGMYTGVPNISIPLYNLRHKDIEVPVSLSYHSAGIQVDQIASEVGLGWILNAGGSISKSPRGLPDDVQNGFLKYDVPELADIGFDYDFYDDVVLGERDTESDIYHYNFAGYSGKFFFDRDQNIRLVEEKPISIEYFEGVPTKFVITTEHGLIFEFEENEQTRTVTLGGDNEQSYTSSWYLSKITSKNGIDEVSFIYETVTQFSTYQYNYRETTAVGWYPTNTYPTDHEFGHLSSVSQTTTTPKRLKEILFPNGKILLNRADGRLDTGSEYLKEVEILENNGISYDTIKSFEFVQDYYYSNTNIVSPVNLDSTDARRYRLKLTELREYDNSKSESKNHLFWYNDDMLPPINSNGKDYWGYYNGQDSNLTLLPKQDYKISGNYVGDADREPSLTEMDNGILNRITYPTGGYTEFLYEPNQYITTDGIIEEIPAYAQAAGLPGQMGMKHLVDSVEITPNYAGYATLNIEVSNMTSASGGTFPRVILDRTGRYPYTLLDQIISPAQYPDIYPPGNNTSEVEITFDPVFLDKGVTYQLKVMVEGESTSMEFGGAAYILADITYKNRDTTNTTPVSKIAGGLRIQKINSYSEPNKLAFSKTYEYESEKLLTPEIFLKEQYLIQDVIYMRGGGIGCPSDGPFERKFLNGGTVQNLTLSGGSPVVYGLVNEFKTDGSNNNIGKTVYTFDIQEDIVLPVGLTYMGGIMLLKKDWMGGQNKTTTTYPSIGSDYITKEENGYINKKYDEVQSYKMYKVLPFAKMEGPGTSCWRELPDDNLFKYSIFEYPIFTGTKVLSSSVKSTKDLNGDEVTTTTSIYYDNEDHLQPTRVETTGSDGKTILTKTFYPDDITSTTFLGNTALTTEQYSAIERLKRPSAANPSGEHRIAEPIQTEIIVAGDTTVQRTNYRTWSGHSLTLPEFVETSKDGRNLESRLEYLKYDSYGNPLELSKANGSIISYFWGHGGKHPIAKIENASYADIASALGVSEIALESYDEDDLSILNGLRSNANLTKSMVTTFTYDPLIGVLTTTDPRGYTTTYVYDDFNRLKEVRDEDLNLISDYLYNYKN